MPEPHRANDSQPIGAMTFLFTDIEGSTRLWEEDPERMRPALARHDAISRATVESHHGHFVKSTGDGVYAAFNNALDALRAAVALQQALADSASTSGVPLRVRSGLHAGIVESRDGDFFGPPLNRAVRIMTAAHGGQILLSQIVADGVREQLPPDVELRDLGRVRLKDLSNPEHVYQVIHRQLRQEFPALRSLEATPNNLPQQATSFIGRDKELADLRSFLGRARTLTLTGSGGCGKTRLCLQIAADSLERFSDGAWMVELASLADPDLVPQTVAMVLGLKDEPGKPIHQALTAHLKDKQLLLLLDNCEHLLDACAKLADALMRQCPGVRILASSREALGIGGEQVYRVPSLSLPDLKQAHTRGSVVPFEAVQLFTERALLVRSDFQVTDNIASALASICCRLDGIPLAIELAAARVSSLSVETIDRKLDQRFRLLTEGSRTALPRQQTLRAVLDWSYELLNKAERTVFARLSVFAGGWTLDALDTVCAGEPIGKDELVYLLIALVEKSLVVADDDGDRYRLLETARSYALGRLHESDEGDHLRTRHLEYYVTLAEEAEPELVGTTQGEWLARLDHEHENFLAAHAWCDRAPGGGELGLRLVFCLKAYFLERGLVTLGHRLSVESLIRPLAQGRNLARCRTLWSAGELGYFMGRYKEAKEYVATSLEIALELQDVARVAEALRLLGYIFFALQDSATARLHFEDALARSRQLGDKLQISKALNGRATLYFAQGELGKAAMMYEEALALQRQRENRSGIAIALQNLGETFIALGSGDRGRAVLREAMAIAGEIGSKRAGVAQLNSATQLAALLGEWEIAARLYGATEAQLEKTGHRREPMDEVGLAPHVARTRDTLGAAAFAAAESAGRLLSYDAAIAEVRAWLE